MAQVLSPIASTTGTITMPYSPADAYQNAPSQPHHPQQRASQMPRNQMHNGYSGGTGYRGTSAPIAPYAFSSTPQLRQDNRSVSAPHPQGLQQPPSHVNHARLGHPSHPSSSSDSTVSTSGSSSRSLVNPPHISRDDSDIRKQVDGLASSLSLPASIPDLSLSLGDAPVKPSPGRYRRAAGRTDSSNSVPTGATTPTQRSSNVTPTVGPAAPLHAHAPTGAELAVPHRPGHGRANSADDMQLRAAGLDAAKRYRRRSFNGLDANGVAVNIASAQPGPTAAAGTTPNMTSSSARPASSGRQGSRPVSSHSHERQSSAGSASSHASSRPQVGRRQINT
jgi:hypothetical protein